MRDYPGIQPNTKEPTANRVFIIPDGPIIVKGDVEVVDADRNLLFREERVALCRCGRSGSKPRCDGTHRKIGFEHSGAVEFERMRVSADETVNRLRIRCRENGPLVLEGAFEIGCDEGRMEPRGRAVLCRCGSSQEKPFCDGSHQGLGFAGD